jgi:hypothetical protein
MTYWVDLQVPGFAGCVKINGDLLEVEARLLERDVGAVSPWAQAVGVKDDLGSGHDGLVTRMKNSSSF